MINNQHSEATLKQSSIKPLSSDTISKSQKKERSGKSLSLRAKATLLAIAIGVIPVATVGLFSYLILNRSLNKQISEEQIEITSIAADNVTRFLEDRIREIETLAQDAVLTNPKFRDAATLQEKTAILDNFKDQLQFYNSVVFFDLNGDPIFQAKSDTPNKTNYGGKKYFQEAIKTEKITINGPGISSSSGQLRVEFAVPVRDKATGKLIGIIRAKIPGNYINSLFDIYRANNEHWHLVNEAGVIFAGDKTEHLNQPIATHFPKLEPLHQAKESGAVISNVMSGNSEMDLAESNRAENTGEMEESNQQVRASGKQQIVSYVAAPAPPQFPNLHIGTIIAKDKDIALASIERLGWTLFLGTAAAAVLVGAIAAYLANRATLPLIDAVASLKQLGSGKLDTRLAVTSDDELGELNSNINLMAEQIQDSLKEQQALAEQQRREKEDLETAIFTMMSEVSDATEGDLTVRANLDSVELSTVADLFNAIISNLQDIAIEAKQSSSLVGSYLKQNEEVVLVLAEQALSEAAETRNTLISVEQMSESIQTVADNASQAEQIANDTYNTAIASTNNMDLTVDSILTLRNTVGETAKKMKRLGESSQKISQAVSLIEEIALKTNILAINASVEAGRAGEYGEGFTIVAEQVASLAEQSANVTKEIAGIVAEIQTETTVVNQAMESGTTQVVETTRLVESTKQSLAEVLEKSQSINQLMEFISQATVSQTSTSQNINSLMQRISQMSETTSKSSQRIAESIVDTAQLAAKLESAVAQFKVAR